MFDPIALVERGYQCSGGYSAWARGIIEPISEALNVDGLDMHGFFLRSGVPEGHFGIDPRGKFIESGEVARQHARVLMPLDAGELQSMWLPLSSPGLVNTADPAVRAFFPEQAQSRVFQQSAVLSPGVDSIGGALGVVLPVNPTNILIFSIMRVAPPERDAAALSLWRMLCVHLSAALRLSAVRPSLEGADVECVMEGDGRVLDVRGTAQQADVRRKLGEAVRRVDRARTREGRSDPHSALAAWSGLFEGRWTLVDYVDTDGKRFVLARHNEPNLWPTQSRRGLSKRQTQILYCAAAGLSNKEIAYLLGLASSTVGTHLRRAFTELGVSSRAEWLRLAGRVEAILRGSDPPDARLSSLTPAEQEIGQMILDGTSTEDIAKSRGSSVNTVSNQIAAILSKLNLTNRQSLVQYLARQG